ncbi:hypothetical protein EU546_07150 [Candidatus Thorarchaeota archaeon]|nr:MAG: hypothetical protein EU546_07150 [Candidatus Thorarchaeota archaeon]
MKITRDQLTVIALSSLPIAIGSLIAGAVRNTTLIGEVIGNTSGFTIIDLAVQALVSTLLGVIVVYALFYMMRQRGHGTRRLVVALVVSPILGFVSIFIGQAFLLILFKGTTSVVEGALLAISVGVSMMSLALVIIDVIPPLVRNLFVAFYGTIFGTFLGVTMVTTSMVVLIISLVIEDYFLTRYSPIAEEEFMSDSIGSDPFDYTRIQSERVVIGVGDFVAYSLIAAHAMIFFPVYVWVLSISLAILGITINTLVFARVDEVLPAIPLPAVISVFPWVVHLMTLSFLLG